MHPGTFAHRRSALACLAMGLLLAAGCAAPSGGPGAQRPQEQAPRFAPYVDVTSGHARLAAGAAASGLRRFVLSFVLADRGSCAPAWGTLPIDDPALRAEVRTLRQSGAAVTVASGGANGAYLETACPSGAALAGAYRRALKATGSRHLDVDIEQSVPADRVADALARVAREQHARITVTLPVADAAQGLDPATTPVLPALAKRHVDATVNVMLMNFPYHGSRRDAVLHAAGAAARQVAAAWHTDRAHAYRRMGLTVMPGRDDMGAITSPADARAVAEFARRRDMASLGMWSLARDNGRCPGRAQPAGDCSGVAQRPYEFSSALSGGTQ